MDVAFAVAGFLLTLVLMVLIVSFVRRTPGCGDDVARVGDSQPRRDARPLWVLMGVAMTYAALIRFVHTLTGVPLLDGATGLAVGLYICSHPAANAINMLFFERDAQHQVSEWPLLGWLGLNLLTLLAGWMVVFVALRRITWRVI